MRRDRLYESIVARQVLLDAAVAALLLVLLALPYAFSGDGERVLLSLPLLAPLVWRRGRPVVAVAVVFAGALVQWLVALARPELLLLPADVGVLLALYAVAGYGLRWASRLGLGFALFGAVLLAVGSSRQSSGPFELEAFAFVLLAAAGVVLAAWTGGDLRRVRRVRARELQKRVAERERERE